MSLKAVHIFFVVVSTLFCAGFCLWSLRQFQATGSGLDLAFGLLSLLGAVGLPVYGRWFLKKMKKVSYV